MATLTTLIARLRRRVGNPSTTEASDATLTEHLNSAIRDIVTRYPHRVGRAKVTVATVAGTASYNIPTPTTNIVVMKVTDRTNRRRLIKIADRQAATLDDTAGTPTQGQPEYYALWANTIQLYPVPNGVYTIELFVRQIPTDLALGSDVPILNTTWDDGIVLLARWYYWDDKANPAQAQYAYTMFKTWLSDKPLEINEEKYDIDAAVELPVLGGSSGPRLPWDNEA